MKKTHIFLLLLLTSVSSFAQTRYLEYSDSADASLKREDWERAEQFIKRALNEEPSNFNNALLLSNLGITQTQQGKYDEALESYNIGISIAPKSTTLLTNRAKLLMMLERYADAHADLSKALQIDPTHTMPLKLRGLLRLRTNDIAGAETDLLRLSELLPKDTDALAGLAQCAFIDGDPAKALEYYNKALAIDSQDPAILLERAILYLEEGKYSEAMADLNTAISIDPEDGFLYLYRALAHRKLYETSAAEEDKKNAIAHGVDHQTIEEFFK